MISCYILERERIYWERTLAKWWRKAVIAIRYEAIFSNRYASGMSDESILDEWFWDTYFQYITGVVYFEHKYPADQSTMSRWRKKLSESGAEKRFDASFRPFAQRLPQEKRPKETLFGSWAAIRWAYAEIRVETNDETHWPWSGNGDMRPLLSVARLWRQNKVFPFCIGLCITD